MKQKNLIFKTRGFGPLLLGIKGVKMAYQDFSVYIKEDTHVMNYFYFAHGINMTNNQARDLINLVEYSTFKPVDITRIFDNCKSFEDIRDTVKASR